MYDGTDLINDAGGDVVVVVIQYRLALFGQCLNVWAKTGCHDTQHYTGFMGGTEMKQKGALNAGLRK